MKLATLRDGSRDGRLVVVSRDVTQASDARHIAPTLQAAHDDWDRLAPHLELVARGVETGGQPVARFHERDALSPMPRAYQFVTGPAYPNHAERTPNAPEDLRRDPPIRQGGSDGFRGPRDPIRLADARWDADLGPAVAVSIGDVAMGAGRAAASAAIRLVMLANDVSLRAFAPGEAAAGFGFFLSQPATAFSPVAVTPDDLGDAWDGAKLLGALSINLNGAALGRLDIGEFIQVDFADLIVQASRTRALAAGTIVGSGTISSRAADGGPGLPVSEGGLGYGCLAELRAVETIRHGAPRTPFLVPGDTVRIEMKDGAGHSIFGAIEQTVELWEG